MSENIEMFFDVHCTQCRPIGALTNFGPCLVVPEAKVQFEHLWRGIAVVVS